MKKNIYFILFLFYFIILGFILYLNGVFTGNITSYSNLIINVGILLIIGILFTVSSINFMRLNHCTDALTAAVHSINRKYKETNANLWNDYKDQNNMFGNAALDKAFSQYQKHMKGSGTRHEPNRIIDIEEYINEDLLDQISASHFNSSISGTMTGLGILGTFIGLSLGLSAFSGNDIFTISDNVGPLLNGMKVAFHTSVYGIFFSLIFNFVYRSIMAYSYEKLSAFLSCFRECIMPQFVSDINDNSKAMLIYQANMANSMKAILELLKGNSTEQIRSIEHMVQEFSRQLTLTMGADLEKLGRSLNAACDAQAVYSHNYQSMENTARELLDANRVLQESLEHTINWQEMFARELKKQQEKISDACDTINNDITAQLYTFNQMRDLYDEK